MFKAFVPSITLPAGKSDIRKGGGIGIICNGQTMLVDGFEGGEPTNGMKAWLAENDVSTVKTAVLTHVHYDHYHGLMEIEDDSRFHIETVLMYDPLTLKHGCDGSANGDAVKDDMNNAYKFIRYMQARGTKVKWIDKGSTVKCGDTSWKVYRNQPRHFTDDDDGNAYAFVNNGSLVLCSPEVPLLFGGDGCVDLEDAIAYFHQIIIAMYVQHHGNCCPESDAKAAKEAGVILMWETNVERKGAGTTGFTMYGSRRVVQQGIPVWMQNEPIYITAANGKITFKQGSKTVTAKIPYEGKCEEGWVHNHKGWWFRLSDGSYAKGWRKCLWSKEKVNGSWFLFRDDGYMKTGWQKVNGKWYYLDPKTGAMQTGWIYVNGIWYYLEESGAMKTGWMDWKGRKCYLDPANGHCLVNCTRVIDGKTYRFDRNGYATEIDPAGDITTVSGKLNDISASRRQFVIDIANYVRKYAPQYGICVYSPIIAQAIHESGWGESRLAAQYHNYFGMKCGTKWTGRSVNMKTQEEYSAGSLSTISANFRAYDNMEEGVKGYFEFIQLPRYANLKGVTSPRQYLQNIKDDGYATGSKYVDNTMNLVNLYNLTQFDVALPAEEPRKQGQREAIVSEAISHVGVKEGTVLHHKIIDRYNSRKPLPRGYAVKYTDAWCATFISYLAIVMGYTDIIPVECGCPQMITLAKQMGIWVEDDSYVPKPGDIVLYDWQDSGSGDNTGNPDHIGIVEKVVGNTETVIEGNYQDSVKRRELAVNGRYIRGYIVPKYQ